MATGCVFCDIATGNTSTQLRYEWKDVVGFVPLNPVAEGHLLFIPVLHVKDFASAPALTALVVARAAEVVQNLGIDCNLITSKGSAASQTVFHFHLHVVPRKDNDGLALPWTGQHDR